MITRSCLFSTPEFHINTSHAFSCMWILLSLSELNSLACLFQVILDWELPRASDQFMDVKAEFLVEWRTEASPTYVMKLMNKNRVSLPHVSPQTVYYFRVKVIICLPVPDSSDSNYWFMYYSS